MLLIPHIGTHSLHTLNSVDYGATTTDREQCQLAEKGNRKYIFTIPRAILPKPSVCDKITLTKSL